jgi:hypothetical protein
MVIMATIIGLIILGTSVFPSWSPLEFFHVWFDLLQSLKKLCYCRCTDTDQHCVDEDHEYQLLFFYKTTASRSHRNFDMQSL